MSDGSRFTAVAQAVNEAKWLVDYDLEKELDSMLLLVGFLREDLFKYNRLRITERLEVKEKLLHDVDLVGLKQLEKQERDNEKLKKDFDIMLPFLKDQFNDNVRLLIVGRFLVTNFNDKLESFLMY
jgi:hypothetical protein